MGHVGAVGGNWVNFPMVNCEKIWHNLSGIYLAYKSGIMTFLVKRAITHKPTNFFSFFSLIDRFKSFIETSHVKLDR